MSKDYSGRVNKFKLEKYEAAITSSKLFSLDKDKEYVEYSREKAKFIENLFKYLYAVDMEYYEKFNLEIMETVLSCINNFSCEKGEFFNYFRASVKSVCVRADAARKAEERRCGIHVTEDKKRLKLKIEKYLRAKGIETVTNAQITALATILGEKEDVIREELYFMQNESVAYDTQTKADGETLSLLEMIASDDAVEKRVINEEQCRVLLDKIEEAFVSCQERQKPILSELLTACVCKSGIVKDKEIHIDYGKYSFISQDGVKDYILNNKIPLNKEIAEKYEKGVTAVSRTLREFLAKVEID